jgi:hypothetical protein
MNNEKNNDENECEEIRNDKMNNDIRIKMIEIKMNRETKTIRIRIKMNGIRMNRETKTIRTRIKMDGIRMNRETKIIETRIRIEIKTIKVVRTKMVKEPVQTRMMNDAFILNPNGNDVNFLVELIPMDDAQWKTAIGTWIGKNVRRWGDITPMADVKWMKKNDSDVKSREVFIGMANVPWETMGAIKTVPMNMVNVNDVKSVVENTRMELAYTITIVRNPMNEITAIIKVPLKVKRTM